MNWNKHYNLQGTHAPYSASQGYWVNYDDDKFIEYAKALKAKERGTELHAYAEMAIRLGIKQRNTKQTLNMFINDAIGYDMEPEQVLYFSMNFYGTSDAISFRNNTLRIHDLKTGEGPTHMRQLEIYAALFCLEYKHKPEYINIILRIYQSNDIQEEVPDPEVIKHHMERIKSAEQLLNA